MNNKKWLTLVALIAFSTASIQGFAVQQDSVATETEQDSVNITEEPTDSNADEEVVEEEVTEDAADTLQVAFTATTFSQEDIDKGQLLFSGAARFTNGGPSCVTCHNVTNDKMIDGGLLAKDLTNAYSRMGEEGLAGIMSSPPFPAMTSAYEGKALDSTEVAQLTAFLQYADQVSAEQQVSSGYDIFFIYGGIGFVVWMVIVYAMYANRKKHTVKREILARQNRAADSTNPRV